MRRPIAALIVIDLLMTCAASADDRQAITAVRAVLDRQVADWNRGDLDSFLGGYWRSPKVVFQSGGDRCDGWDAMRDRFLSRYKGTKLAMGRLAFDDVEIEVLGPETAFARGRWGLTTAEAGHPHGLFTVILRKLPEGWRIVHDHTSVDAAPGKQEP
jgi:beta-aspartyl-peptidase (threonine type)